MENNTKMVMFKLEKGTINKIALEKSGLPFELVLDVEARISDGNYNWLCNQLKFERDTPVQADIPRSSVTNNASSESI